MNGNVRFRIEAAACVALLVVLSFQPAIGGTFTEDTLSNAADVSGPTGPADPDEPHLDESASPPEADGTAGGVFVIIAILLEVVSDDEAPANVDVYVGLSVLYETNPATKYVFANGLLLAKTGGATTEYYHYDHLGNVRLVTSGSNGNVLTTFTYKPFGICVYGCASEPKYGYTGEYREAAPNLIYLHSRWYDPTIGRFISPDDRLGRLSLPQDQNRYAYVLNNPLKYTDPTGHDIWSDLKSFLNSGHDQAVSFAQWWSGASDAERWGFIAGVATAFLIGVAVGFACVSVVACGPVAAAAFSFGAVTLGALAAAALYIGVTEKLGGTPTPEGLAFTTMAAMAVAGIGFGVGGAFGSLRMIVRSAPARGANSQQVARESIVGTPHNDYRPSQWSVSRSKVLRIAAALERGEQVESIKYYEFQGAKYIHDGHHRYVASRMTGIPVRTVEIERPWSGYLQPLYDDWTSVHFRG